MSAPVPDAHFSVDIVLQGPDGKPIGPHWPIAFSQVLLPHISAAPDPAARLVLRRAATGALDLYQWLAAERANPGKAPHIVTVQAMRAPDTPPAIGWRFNGAHPLTLGFGPLDALSGAILIETLELGFATMDVLGDPVPGP